VQVGLGCGGVLKPLLIQWLETKGYRLAAKRPLIEIDDETQRGAFVYWNKRWTILLFSEYGEFERLGYELAKLKRPILFLWLHDSDLWGYQVEFDRHTIASFNSNPTYFGKAEAYDAEGFYKLGDALRFDDPADPNKGLLFEGRIAEDFKLATGTWVGVGLLRVATIAHCAPYVKDVVIAGADRDFIAVLIFPDVEACRRLASDLAQDASAAQVLAHDSVRREFRRLLSSFARQATGSSNRVARAILDPTPPSLDSGEATDKGSINQRMVLKHRAALVDELYADVLSARVIVVDER